jgi:hypothetical protein
MGRRPRTIEWYRQKMAWYQRTGQADTPGELTAYELKRYLGELRDRDLADNTIHGFFEVLRAFASWADREGYAVDRAMLRVRAPKAEQMGWRRIRASSWPPSSLRCRRGGRRSPSRSCSEPGCGCPSCAAWLSRTSRTWRERVPEGPARQGGEIPPGAGQQPPPSTRCPRASPRGRPPRGRCGIDPFVFVATVAAIANRRCGRSTLYAWALAALYSAGTVAGNIMAAGSDHVAQVVHFGHLAILLWGTPELWGLCGRRWCCRGGGGRCRARRR